MMIVWILLGIATFILWKLSQVYSYWTYRNVKQVKKLDLLKENLSIFLRKESLFDKVKWVYDTFPNER